MIVKFSFIGNTRAHGKEKTPKHLGKLVGIVKNRSNKHYWQQLTAQGILENGFAPLYKPPGKYFDACAEGLLLMLAPWPYHMEKRTITRQQCLALNDMAAAISNEPWTQELEQALRGR